jgi:hypothetical protein
MQVCHPEGLQLTGAHGEARGYVDFQSREGRPVLDDLWIMQGSVCDLKCKHCYTASSPSNHTLEQIRFEELRPHLEQAAAFGVQKIYFTGGEAFVNEEVLRGRAARNEEFLRSLASALEIAPVEVLTNARRHIRAHFDALRDLRARHGSRLRLRISIESPRAEEHDAIRGRGTFAQTVETTVELARMGFLPIVTATRPLLRESSDEEIRGAFRTLFARFGVSVEVNLIGNMLEMGHELVRIAGQGRAASPEVFVSTTCFSVLNRAPESLMCHFSRCIQKTGGELRYYPCPVIYDDRRFDLGPDLAGSFRRVHIAHRNCYGYCLKAGGASCRTRPI